MERAPSTRTLRKQSFRQRALNQIKDACAWTTRYDDRSQEWQTAPMSLKLNSTGYTYLWCPRDYCTKPRGVSIQRPVWTATGNAP
eukprot:5242184-Pyramimonas_sp.AAC.1